VAVYSVHSTPIRPVVGTAEKKHKHAPTAVAYENVLTAKRCVLCGEIVSAWGFETVLR